MNVNRRQALLLSMSAAIAPRLAWAQTADTINLAAICPLTGSYAFTGQRELAGWQDAVNYVNSNGGFAGKQVNVMPLDSEYKVDVGVAQWKKAIAAGPVHFAKADSIPLARAMVPENTDTYKMLLSTTANGSHMTEADGFPYFFIPGPTYSDLTGIALSYIDKAAGPGTHPKLAFVHSNIEFGRDPVPATIARAKELGIDLVLEDETAMSGVDVTASAIKLRNAKPDFVLFHGYAGNVWPDVLRLARDYQVDAKAMGTIWSVDPDTVKGIGPAADGFLGIVPHTLLLAGSDQPIIKIIDGILKQRQGADYGGYAGIGYMSGWANMMLLREIFSRAIKAGDALDGPTLMKHVKSIQNWDSGGVFGGPVSIVNQRVPLGTIYKYNVGDNKVSLDTVAAGVSVL
jgi:branched-chain amino acid transport system substrate-binding protein